MIESVIEFRDTTAGHIMTLRQDVAALPIGATLEQVKNCIEHSRHSRIPIYEKSLDHIVGILHARDLIRLLGQASPQFSIGQIMRPAIYAPETKPLSDLLGDFRHQKVQIAVVLDEYGSTSGVVTIEDVLEELVGEISDEHETDEPAMWKKIDDKAIDADARIRIEDVNRLVGSNLPEGAGYETLGGFLTTSLAHPRKRRGLRIRQSSLHHPGCRTPAHQSRKNRNPSPASSRTRIGLNSPLAITHTSCRFRSGIQSPKAPPVGPRQPRNSRGFVKERSRARGTFRRGWKEFAPAPDAVFSRPDRRRTRRGHIAP